MVFLEFSKVIKNPYLFLFAPFANCFNHFFVVLPPSNERLSVKDFQEPSDRTLQFVLADPWLESHFRILPCLQNCDLVQCHDVLSSGLNKS